MYDIPEAKDEVLFFVPFLNLEKLKAELEHESNKASSDDMSSEWDYGQYFLNSGPKKS